MVQRVATVAFEGIEARAVDVQVQVAPGLPAFTLAGCQCQSGARSFRLPAVLATGPSNRVGFRVGADTRLSKHR
jgi:magnesium chelatase family protein